MDPAQIRAAFEQIARDTKSTEEALDIRLPASSVEVASKEKPHLSRRIFLSGSAAATGLAGLGIFTAPKANQPEAKRPPVPPKATYADTLKDTGLMLLATLVTTKVLAMIKGVQAGSNGKPGDKEAIKLGNPLADDLIEKLVQDPVMMTTFAVVVAPMLEEISYRLAPSLLIDFTLGKNAGTVWEIGVPIAALFTGGHRKNPDGTLADDYIPLPQFMLGLFFWHLMRSRGFSHAVAGHAMVNAIGMAGAVLQRSNRQQKK